MAFSLILLGNRYNAIKRRMVRILIIIKH